MRAGEPVFVFLEAVSQPAYKRNFLTHKLSFSFSDTTPWLVNSSLVSIKRLYMAKKLEGQLLSTTCIPFSRSRPSTCMLLITKWNSVTAGRPMNRNGSKSSISSNVMYLLLCAQMLHSHARQVSVSCYNASYMNEREQNKQQQMKTRVPARGNGGKEKSP